MDVDDGGGYVGAMHFEFVPREDERIGDVSACMNLQAVALLNFLHLYWASRGLIRFAGTNREPTRECG